MSEDDSRFIDQIESQAKHLMRMYEDDELEDKIIELAREWFYKGLKRGLIQAKENKNKEE
jgi:hypothetical protein